MSSVPSTPRSTERQRVIGSQPDDGREASENKSGSSFDVTVTDQTEHEEPGRDREPRGRPSESAAGCSIESLRSAARASQSERTAYGIELHSALPHGHEERAPQEGQGDLLATGASR